MNVVAEDYLATILVILGCFAIYQQDLTSMRVLMDTNNKDCCERFVASFYSTIVPITNNTFVYDFNKLALKIHILAKKNFHFVSVSPCLYQPDNTCRICKSPDIEHYDERVICNKCGIVFSSRSAISWQDVGRIHTSPYYTYDRKSQFSEYLLNYQAKCKNVDYSVLQGLPEHIPNKSDFWYTLKSVCGHRIPIDHVHALYYKYTNISPPNLSRIENKLLTDFDLICKTKTTNFSNQIMTFSLLNKYGITTTYSDVLISQVSQKEFKNMGAVFKLLKWTFVS
jgi:hypothetical protein